MATCTSIDMLNNLVEDFIKQYEEELKDDTLSEIESSEVQDTLDELYNMRKAYANNDKEYMAAQGFVSLQSEDQKAVLEAVFKDILGTTFSFTYGASKKKRQGTLLSATPTASGIRIDFSDNGKPKSYSFSLTSNGRSHTAKNSSSYINIEGIRNVFDNYQFALDTANELELVFGSNDAKVRLDEKYRQDGYTHGNIDHMKDTLKRLHLLGGEKASQAELDTYLELMDKMSPSFFNDLALYIDEEANKSNGAARARRIDITVNPAPRTAGNQQSEASIFMEEIVHSMTASAIHAKTPKSLKLKRQLDNMIELARKQLTWKDFLPKESIDAKKEEAYAKWLYDYIFSDKNADYEFIAKAIAVPEIAETLKHVKIKEGRDNRRLLERINDFFLDVIDVLRGSIQWKDRNSNVHDALVNLAFSFGEINKKANRELEEKGNYLTSLFDVANNMDDSTRIAIDKVKNKFVKGLREKELEEVPEDLYGKVKHLGRFVSLSMINPTYTKAMGAIGTAYGLRPEGTIREIIGGLFETDQAQKVAEFLAMQSGYIDKIRNNQIDLTRKNTLSEFSNPKSITKQEEKDLTAVIADTDLSALFGKDSVAKTAGIRQLSYDNKTLRKLLTDDAALDTAIKSVKRTLKDLDSTHYYWHSNQSVGLGIFMANHRGTPEQNLNAFNIARGIHSTHRKRPNAKVIAAIDELSTLVALKNTDSVSKETVANLMKTEWKGVQHIADTVEGFKVNSDETVFKGNKTNKIKGYTREVFDDSIVMEVAPLEDRAKMEAQGFKMRSKLAPRAGDVRNKPMALYVTDSATRPERLRGGVRLNQVRSKGTSITDLSYKDGKGTANKLLRERAQRDINNIQRDALARAKKMEMGEYDFTDTVFGVTAVLDESGKVTDYRYMMDKATKQEMLNQDTRISEVMAKSYGNILDKDMSSQHNKKALEIVLEDMKENWSGGNKGNDGLTDYTVIGPNEEDPEMRKLYYMLPKEFHEAAKLRNDGVIAVRSDLRHLLFGYSHLSIMDFPGLEKITPKVLARFIRFVETIWMDFVKIAKTNILMKMPTVLLSNMFSNLVYGVMRGYNPFVMIKMYADSYQEITAYNKNVKEIQSLENSIRELKIVLGKDTLSTQRKSSVEKELKRSTQKLEAMQRRLIDSPIDELVKLGLDQNVEDVTNDTEHDTNRITTYLDNKLQAAPELVRDGLDILFITKRTKFYKVANEFLEISDLMSRDVQNRMEKRIIKKQANNQKALPAWWLEDKPKGYAARQRLTGSERAKFIEEANKRREYDLVEDFVNYAKPSGRFEEYLNRVGILMFTKYVKRIQRIIAKTARDAPIKAAISLLAITFIGGLPSIHEQSFFAKDWYSESLGAGNVFPIYSPIDIFMNVITPSLLKASTYDFSL